MRKLLITLLMALLVATSVTSIFTADDSIDVNINITEGAGNSIEVNVPNDPHYETLKPTFTMDVGTNNIKVTKNGVAIRSTCVDGVLQFTITGGGTYVIEETDDSGNLRKYVVPKTGVE